MGKLNLICFSICVVSVMGQSYEDKRCQCICPTPDNVFNNTNTNESSFFKASIPPSKCNCYGLIVPKLGDAIKGRERQFCQRCECKFERRNTTVIMLVVVMVLWVLALLSVYMIFLLILDPVLNLRKQQRNRQSINDEESRTLLINSDCENEE